MVDKRRKSRESVASLREIAALNRALGEHAQGQTITLAEYLNALRARPPRGTVGRVAGPRIWYLGSPPRDSIHEAIDSQLAVFLNTKTVFPELSTDLSTLKSLLAGLNRTEVLFLCSRLNLLVSDRLHLDSGNWEERHLGQQLYLAAAIFSGADLQKVEKFLRERPSSSVVFRGQLLEMMRWTALFCEDRGDTRELAEHLDLRRKFSQSLLVVSDIWGRRLFQDALPRSAQLEERRYSFLPAARQGTIELKSADLTQAVVRGREIITENLAALYPDFEARFRKRTGLSFDEYYLCLTAVLLPTLGLSSNRPDERSEADRRFNPETLCREMPALAGPFTRFMSLTCQSPDELRHALWGDARDADDSSLRRCDLRIFRERPILMAGGTAIVMDPYLFAEKASAGPLFYVLGGDDNKIFGYFGEAFERYCGSILRSIYPHAAGLFDPLVLNPEQKGRGGSSFELADACISGADEMALLETKGVWIRDEEVIAGRDRYIEHLRKKYVKDAERPVKGVGQLARAIRRLCDREATDGCIPFQVARRIYPVLLVYDSALDCPLHNWFLAKEFRELLTGQSGLEERPAQIGRHIVDNLVILTIDDLELLESSTTEFALLDMLRDYSNSHPERLSNVHNFMVADPKYSRQIIYSERLRERFSLQLKRLGECLVPSP